MNACSAHIFRPLNFFFFLNQILSVIDRYRQSVIWHILIAFIIVILRFESLTKVIVLCSLNRWIFCCQTWCAGSRLPITLEEFDYCLKIKVQRGYWTCNMTHNLSILPGKPTKQQWLLLVNPGSGLRQFAVWYTSKGLLGSAVQQHGSPW